MKQAPVVAGLRFAAGRLAALTLVSAACTTQPERLHAVRPPVWAGWWYERDAQKLGVQLDAWLASAPRRSGPPVGALVAPHAMHPYGARVQAAAYGAIRDQRFDRIFVLSETHEAHFSGIALPNVDAMGTPFGAVKIDTEAFDVLARTAGVRILAAAYDDDFTIESQLLWLKRLWPDARVVPLLFGWPLEPDDGSQVAAAMADLLDERTLVVVSANLSHHSGHGWNKPPWWGEGTASQYRNIGDQDLVTLFLLGARMPEELAAWVAQAPWATCGSNAFAVLLDLPGLGSGFPVSWGLSLEDESELYAEVISYAALAFKRLPGYPPSDPTPVQ